MENYAAFKTKVSQQLKGYHMQIFFWLFITSFVFSLGKDVLYQYVDASMVSYISFIVSMIYLIINDAVLFLFIKRVRKESFTKEDIIYVIKKFPFILLAGIIIALVQALISSVLILSSVFPPLFYIVVSTANLIFLLWNALIAFGIYDGNTKMRELIMGSADIIFSNIKTILRSSIIYIIWYIVIQLSIVYMLQFMLGNLNTINVISVFEKALHASPLEFAGTMVIYALNYTIQYVLIIPIYIGLANLYEGKREIVMPSGTRMQNLEDDKISETDA